MGRPTIVSIPGASSLPIFSDRLVAAVTSRGYTIHTLQLPSVGLSEGPQEGPPSSMYDDAALISSHVSKLADAGQDILLVTHSYGGTPATESLRGLSKRSRRDQDLPGGVIGIAYITSFVPEVGKSAGSIKAGFPGLSKVPMAVDEAGWLYYTDIPGVAAMSFSSMPPEEGQLWAGRLARHSAASFANPLTYAGFKDVPVSYLLCENDLAIPPIVQQSIIDMIERETGRSVDVTSIDADHVAPLSSPDTVAEWIVGIAEKLTS
ncbi:Alpha/beta hydrolase fold-1 [Stachybotrys elegans]|uniref:Alpha/beta hydrolase fold-1 n=1 Tax=Stachybotrys elegans TaxID=80388 RepID=A0A8K0WMA4_9HYPO|nr:Alpha/beta hydrolase fold-1 [Stachybotrys elegans]